MGSQGARAERTRFAPERLWRAGSAFIALWFSHIPCPEGALFASVATHPTKHATFFGPVICLWSTTAAAICLTLLLAACGHSESAGSLPVVTPDATMVSNESSSISDYVDQATARPNFSTVERLEATGLIGDGVTDNTLALTALLGTGNRTIHIRAGDYVTGKLSIPSNTVLLLDVGVTIRDSGKLGPEDRLLNIVGDNNVYIKGLGARIIANRANYTTGEQRHGVFIYGASHVVIEGLESTGHGGDGFYVGGPTNVPSQDIILVGCLASDNRRQGLSITSAKRVYVVDCEFDKTNGTAPQFGVDLEPNLATDFLDEIRLLRPHTFSNVGGGIQICLDQLSATSPMVDIEIIEHLSESETPKFITLGPSDVRAQIQYSDASIIQ